MTTVVIGGGLAGISAALTLQDAGEEVELYEASDAVGGRVRSDYVDGYILDRGFQLINAGYPEIKRVKVIEEIDFRKASRSIDVVTPFGISSIGDPRIHPLQGVRSPLGSISEKLAFVKFMGEKANGNLSLRDALLASGTGNFYENLLRPFLQGVFLADLNLVDSAYGRDIIKSFIVGDSGLPSAGVGTLSEALAARIETIHLNAKVDSLDQFAGKKIILALDAQSNSSMLGHSSDVQSVDSYTWYHALPESLVTSKSLRTSSASTPLVNSIAISNVVGSYAPGGKTLISSTSILPIDDAAVLSEISKFWSIAPSEFELIRRYEIKNSLPLFSPGAKKIAGTSKVGEGIYRAGDYLTAGSQNGALLSGRLAAMELLLDQS